MNDIIMTNSKKPFMFEGIYDLAFGAKNHRTVNISSRANTIIAKNMYFHGFLKTRLSCLGVLNNFIKR